MENIEKYLDIDKIIEYMENTAPEAWCEKVVRTKDGRNCFFGHLYEYAGGEAGYGSQVCDDFESRFATTFMIYPVNDGDNSNYPQSSPKERIIAFLKNLRDGKEMTTYQCMEWEAGADIHKK